MPRRNEHQQFSRRQALIGLGLLGAGALTCGGALGFGLMRLLSDREPQPRIEIVTAMPEEHTPPFPIVSREEWGALPPDHTARNEGGFFSALNNGGWRVYDGDLAEIYRTVVIHHSVTLADTDRATLQEIQTLHRGDRGWADVGYHYFIGTTGTIYAGRDLNVRGTHVGGHNTGSVGVCLLGNFMEVAPDDAQLAAADRLIGWLTQYLALSHLAGHSEFNAGTVCPGDNLAVHLNTLAERAGLIRGTEGYVPPV